MTLAEYVAKHCPNGPADLRKLILERTGVNVPYTYLWKWTDINKPAAMSVEYAELITRATNGACALPELLSLKVIRDAIKARKLKPQMRQPRRPAEKTAAGILRRIDELERRVDELERRINELAMQRSA